MCLYIYIFTDTIYTNVYAWTAYVTIRDDTYCISTNSHQEKAIQVLDLFGEFLFRFASLFRFPNVTPKRNAIKCLDPHPDLQVAAGWQHPLSWHSAKKTISWWWMGVEMDGRMGSCMDASGWSRGVGGSSSLFLKLLMNHFHSSFWGSLFASFQLSFNFPRVHLVSRENDNLHKSTTVMPYGLPENCTRKSSFTQPSTLQVGRASRSVPIDPYGSSTSVGAEMGTAFSPKLMYYAVYVYPHIHISLHTYIWMYVYIYIIYMSICSMYYIDIQLQMNSVYNFLETPPGKYCAPHSVFG